MRKRTVSCKCGHSEEAHTYWAEEVFDTKTRRVRKQGRSMGKCRLCNDCPGWTPIRGGKDERLG
jgi:hypothetical protein